MAAARFLHVGVSGTDGHAGAVATALGCSAAAHAMSRVAKALGHTPTTLIDRDATFSNVTAAFARLASELTNPGDLFVVTLAGHGVVLEGRAKAGHPHDRAMLLWDDYLVNSDVRELCLQITHGIDVVILADGCFTGAMLSPRRPDETRQSASRAVIADVLLVAAASETRLAPAALNGGPPPFTRAVVDNWHTVRSYEDLLERIKDTVPDARFDQELLIPGSRLPHKKPFIA